MKCHFPIANFTINFIETGLIKIKVDKRRVLGSFYRAANCNFTSFWRAELARHIYAGAHPDFYGAIKMI